jgi:hypothetical protein
MIFKIDPRLKNDTEAAAMIAELWLTKHSFDAILKVPSFNHTNKSPQEIASFVKAQANLHAASSSPECFLTLLSVPWFKRIIYRNTVAEHSFGRIAFNRKFLKRDLADTVNTICHEYSHYIGFSHDGNSPTPYNLASVPYQIGSLAEAWVRSQEK